MLTLKVFQELLEFCVELNSEEFGVRKSDFLSFVASLHRSLYVHVVIFDYAQDNIAGTYAFSSLGSHELSSSFNVFINVLHTNTSVRNVVMGDVVDVVLLNKVERDDPWTWAYYLVHPLAVIQDLRSFELVHDNFTFLCNRFLIARYAYDQINMFE